jgi:adenylate cyclase
VTDRSSHPADEAGARPGRAGGNQRLAVPTELLRAIGAWTAALALYLLILVMGRKGPLPASWGTHPASAALMLGALGVLWGGLFAAVNRWSDRPQVRSRSFVFLLGVKLAVMLLATALTALASSLANVALGAQQAGTWISSSVEFLGSGRVVPLLLYVGVVTLVLGFARQVSIMVGPRVLRNVMLGYYRRPRAEERVFLFLDLNGSTRHAERLGHERYCRLIQDCFRDLTEAAVRHDAEIYQYVGDEAVLTWWPEAAARDGNCVRVLADFDRTLDERAAHYLSEYGEVPRFKAGVNAGVVMAAEIGVVKRDIVYLSEVLHIAARIQSQCNPLGRRLLISRAVRELLPATPDLAIEAIGEVELRGRGGRVEIFAVGPAPLRA